MCYQCYARINNRTCPFCNQGYDEDADAFSNIETSNCNTIFQGLGVLKRHIESTRRMLNSYSDI